MLDTIKVLCEVLGYTLLLIVLIIAWVCTTGYLIIQGHRLVSEFRNADSDTDTEEFYE